ncbi:MAG: hypothetical protein F6K26_11745 [Moorea sp. SIO2I5]|nr:hypothetical protein [Moorena sp. SIO2I5]
MESSGMSIKKWREEIENIFNSECSTLQKRIKALDDRITHYCDTIDKIEDDIIYETDSIKKGKLEKELEDLKKRRQLQNNEKDALFQKLKDLYYNHIKQEKEYLKKLKLAPDNVPTPDNDHGPAHYAEQLVEHIDEHEKDFANFENELEHPPGEEVPKINTPHERPWGIPVRQLLNNMNAFLQIRCTKTKELVVVLCLLFLLGLGIKTITYHQCSDNRLNVCRSALLFYPNSVNTLITAGRATFLKLNPESDIEVQKSRVYQTKKYFYRAVAASEKSDISEKAKAFFYQSFMKDFDRFVINKNFSCTENNSVENIYKDVLDIYENDDYQVSNEEYFIFLELSHFLMHRDKDYEKALGLLDKAALAKPDQEASDEIKQQYKAVLLTKAKAESYLKRFEDAKVSLRDALDYESRYYKIKRDLASVSAQVAVDASISEEMRYGALQDAIKYYEQVLEEGIATNDYRARRNLSFLYYLRGDRKAITSFRELTNSGSFPSGKTLRFDSSLAIESDIKSIRKLIDKYQDFAERKCFDNQEGCNGQGKVDLLRTELKNARIFHDYFITHDVIEEDFNDPFFALEHDKFYKCNQF